MTCCPNAFVNGPASARAIESDNPPAGYGTRKVTVFVG